EPLERPRSAGAAREQRALLKPHGSELRLQAVGHATAGLSKGDRHFVETDVAKFTHPLCHVVTERPHGPGEIESLRHAHPARNSFCDSGVQSFADVLVACRAPSPAALLSTGHRARLYFSRRLGLASLVRDNRGRSAAAALRAVPLAGKFNDRFATRVP